MNNKYVIKNCPAYKNNFCSIRNFYIQGCANCTDCVMKQIVELLQQYDKENFNWCEPISFNTENIYELLKIQEVE